MRHKTDLTDSLTVVHASLSPQRFFVAISFNSLSSVIIHSYVFPSQGITFCYIPCAHARRHSAGTYTSVTMIEYFNSPSIYRIITSYIIGFSHLPLSPDTKSYSTRVPLPFHSEAQAEKGHNTLASALVPSCRDLPPTHVRRHGKLSISLSIFLPHYPCSRVHRGIS